jgi:hypothetical protein
LKNLKNLIIEFAANIQNCPFEVKIKDFSDFGTGPFMNTAKIVNFGILKFSLWNMKCGHFFNI